MTIKRIPIRSWARVASFPESQPVGRTPCGYSADNSCILLRALLCCPRCRVSRGRKPIRRDRCASSSGSPAGGGADIVARLLGQWLSEHLGQPFIIENRPGAASNIGTETVVQAAPDGYTLLLVVLPPNAINATLYDKLNFDLIRDIAPVASIHREQNVMEVNPSLANFARWQ